MRRRDRNQGMANESRLSIGTTKARQREIAFCASAVPLLWLTMLRSSDLQRSGQVTFAVELDTALTRLADPSGARKMFAEYGDLAPFAALLAETLAEEASPLVTVSADEIAGEHPDPRAWARSLAVALDGLDDPGLAAAPFGPPSPAVPAMTELQKMQRVRDASTLGLQDARALLHAHDGDLHAALAHIEAGKSAEQRARDQAGDFVASLISPHPVADAPPWRTIMSACGLEHGRRFPRPDLLLAPPSTADSEDQRVHTRLLGEGTSADVVAWEPHASP
ncbi:hypothetical protein ACUOFU_09230 [Microbacterium arabinogalactanolyticum]